MVFHHRKQIESANFSNALLKMCHTNLVESLGMNQHDIKVFLADRNFMKEMLICYWFYTLLWVQCTLQNLIKLTMIKFMAFLEFYLENHHIDIISEIFCFGCVTQ